jgi:endonuclease IV
MDLLNAIIDTTKQIAGDAIAQKAGAHTEQSADTVFEVFIHWFSAMEEEHKAEFITIIKSVAGSLSGKGESIETIWAQFKDNEMVRNWIGSLSQQLVKRLTQEFLS